MSGSGTRRIRVKVAEIDGELYLAGTFMLNPQTSRGFAFFMRDGRTIRRELSVDDWNEIGFRWVDIGEEAPRPPPEVTFPPPKGRGQA